VAVIGASGFLDKLSTIYTEKIPVTGLEGSGSIEVGLTINPAKLNLATGSRDTVTVYYTVRKRHTGSRLVPERAGDELKDRQRK
jgi:hypothetical protein